MKHLNNKILDSYNKNIIFKSDLSHKYEYNINIDSPCTIILLIDSLSSSKHADTVFLEYLRRFFGNILDSVLKNCRIAGKSAENPKTNRG